MLNTILAVVMGLQIHNATVVGHCEDIMQIDADNGYTYLLFDRPDLADGDELVIILQTHSNDEMVDDVVVYAEVK